MSTPIFPKGCIQNSIALHVVWCWCSRYSDSLRAGRPGDRITVGARFSAPVQTGPGAHPASYTTATGSFPGVKRPGRVADHPPPWKGRAIPLLTLWAFVACYRVSLYLYLYGAGVIRRIQKYWKLEVRIKFFGRKNYVAKFMKSNLFEILFKRMTRQRY